MKAYYIIKDDPERVRVSSSERDEAAEEVMDKGFYMYIHKNGYHFTEKLADAVSREMKNRDGSQHRWTTGQVSAALAAMGLDMAGNGYTIGDATYLANMYYSDFYHSPLREEKDCLEAAYEIMRDADGYDGVAFSRWVADAIGRGTKIDWEEYK